MWVLPTDWVDCLFQMFPFKTVKRGSLCCLCVMADHRDVLITQIISGSINKHSESTSETLKVRFVFKCNWLIKKKRTLPE